MTSEAEAPGGSPQSVLAPFSSQPVITSVLPVSVVSCINGGNRRCDQSPSSLMLSLKKYTMHFPRKNLRGWLYLK